MKWYLLSAYRIGRTKTNIHNINHIITYINKHLKVHFNKYSMITYPISLYHSILKRDAIILKSLSFFNFFKDKYYNIVHNYFLYKIGLL